MSGIALYEEKELLIRIADGDAEAYEIMFRHYFHHLYGLMLKYTHRHIDAEDIVQQIFAVVWEKRHLLPGIERFDKWLYTAAVNEFRTRFRRTKYAEQYGEFLKDTFSEQAALPDDMLMHRQGQEALKRALEQLPPKQQEAYLLSRDGGLTYAEIAAKMQIDKSTVKEHISRALKHIRSAMQANGDLLITVIWGLKLFFEWVSPHLSS